jgi:hypothetical protein
MFPSSLNRQPLAVKLVAVVVLCAFFAISWHVFAAHHTDHFHVTKLCQVCTWMQTAVWLAVFVSLVQALCLIQRFAVPPCLAASIPSSHHPTGRSPPSR